MDREPINIVWFKRDLRIEDNSALADAAATGGAILPLYVVEPDYWRLPDTSARQWQFIEECLKGLADDFVRLQCPLQVSTGDVVQTLSRLKKLYGLIRLFSHQETGNRWTFERDLRVKAWCRREGVAWKEVPQFGVVRPLSNRDGWAPHWDHFMAQPQGVAPHSPRSPKGLGPTVIPTKHDLGLQADPCPLRQPGGRTEGLKLLDSFLCRRGERYRAAMSSPLDGEWACSRLSSHLAYGTLSLKEVAQATWLAQREAKLSAPRGSMWRGSLQSFSARLHWHCHFIQKLEDEPRLEHENLHPAYNDLRPVSADTERLTAWAEGQTGLPFLDACMRFLKATGWLNFRMRAMVMAVASYHLWLPWRATGLVLARRFVDYEPGIHWSQVQMQSGTTGINTPRIYNPVKQGEDQDPTGAFTRKWVPELAKVPDQYLQAPWAWGEAGSLLGKDYPNPIIDPKTAAKEARDKIWAVRKGSTFRNTANQIVKKHGSRKNNDRDGDGRRRNRSRAPTNQLSLFGEG